MPKTEKHLNKSAKHQRALFLEQGKRLALQRVMLFATQIHADCYADLR